MVRVAGALALLCGLLTGCGDPCDPNKDVGRCEGNTTFNCPQPGVDQVVGANRWVSRACPRTFLPLAADSSSIFSFSNTPNSTSRW